jgi:O-antigen ligase
MGIIAMICSIGLMIIAANQVSAGRQGMKIGIPLIVAILGLAIYVGVDPILARFENIGKERASDRDRIALWRDASQVVNHHALFGQGLATFQWTFPAYESVNSDTPARYAHNDYLQILAETGYVGLALMLMLFGVALRIAMKNLYDARDPLVNGIGLGTIGALAAIGLQETTDFGLYIPGVAVVAVLIVGLNLRAQSMMLKH